MKKAIGTLVGLLGTALCITGLYSLIASPDSLFEAILSFEIGFGVLLSLLYVMNLKAGIIYTAVCALLVALGLIFYKPADVVMVNSNVGNVEETNEQVDSSGNFIIEHDYDILVSMSWGTNSRTDMDLRVGDLSDITNTWVVSHENKEYIKDENNRVWLDYDYTSQSDVEKKEVVTILDMEGTTISVFTVLFDKGPLSNDVDITIRFPDNSEKIITVPQDRYNDDTKLLYVCDIDVSNKSVTEVMMDMETNDTSEPKDY